MSFKDHPLAIAVVSCVGTATFAITVLFTAVIPTWSESKQNEIARLNLQLQNLQTEPATIRAQLENLKHEATNSAAASDAARTESAKRIKSLEQDVETERAARLSAEARAMREAKLREQSEEKSRRAEDSPRNIPSHQKEQTSNVSQTVESNDSGARETPMVTPPASANPQTFDLGDIVATAEWARSDKDNLEISFSFVNKTKQPLWMIPTTRRDKGGIQANDNAKNTYQLSGTVGFKRTSLDLRSNLAAMNQFLALQPNVPSMATFRFWRNRGGGAGATEVRFFATLTIVKDLNTLNSYDRTVSATLTLK